jgi:hypothetical protein
MGKGQLLLRIREAESAGVRPCPARSDEEGHGETRHREARHCKGQFLHHKDAFDESAQGNRVHRQGGRPPHPDDRPIIPGENIEAMLTQAGKKRRLGDAFKAGLLCDGEWTLDHDGPKTFDKLKADRRFRDVRKVKIKQNSVMRCRPIFSPWSLKFTIKYLPDLLNESQVVEAVKVAGQIIGLGDYRPKYGRFVVA